MYNNTMYNNIMYNNIIYNNINFVRLEAYIRCQHISHSIYYRNIYET